MTFQHTLKQPAGLDCAFYNSHIWRDVAIGYEGVTPPQDIEHIK